ncbi:RxLR effector protein, partial [Phytophthora megakarya]
MNVYYVVMLFLVSLVQSITGALNVADFSAVTSVLVQPVTDTRKDATIKRLLRSVIEGGEERASGLPVSIVEKAKTIFTATDVTETTLKGWLDKGKSIDDVFLRMRLT